MKPLASISLDLDNLWSYMKTHGDDGWQEYPSYLDIMLPRTLDFFHARGIRLTFFIVGQDAALDKNREALALIGGAGHEVGNHSFRHEPWLHRYSDDEVRTELSRAADAIEGVVGMRPTGFRGPGYSVTKTVLKTLVSMGYAYDASTFPTYIGPLARAYYFMTASLSSDDREDRAELFGSVSDGMRPLKPYLWDLDDARLLEVPVTTLPLFKVPFHLSYVLYLSTFSELAAQSYFRAAMQACLRARLEPSLLLHPLDFLGGDEVSQLAFFPGMNLPGAVKRERVARYLEDMQRYFEVVPLGVHAARIAQRSDLPVRKPDFTYPSLAEPQPARAMS